MRSGKVVLAAAIAVLAGAGVAQASSPATVTGTLGGAKLPRAADGVALVRATSLIDWSIAGTARVPRGGRYTLKLPKGDYALSAVVVRRDAAPLQNAMPVRLRPGMRLKQPLTLKRARKKRKRAGARRSGTNSFGYAYPGIAFGVDDFDGATGDLKLLNEAIPDLLENDLNGYTVRGDRSPGCELTQVEIRRRKEILDEIALSQTAWVDPATRLNAHKLIDPDLIVRGTITVTGPKTNQAIAITARLVDPKTGEIRGATTLRTTADHLFDDIGQLGKQVAQALCHPPHDAYKVDLNIASTYNDTTFSSTGTIQSSLVARLQPAGADGKDTWTGTGPVVYANLAATTLQGTDYLDSGVTGAPGLGLPGLPDWTVSIEAGAQAGMLTVTRWAPPAFATFTLHRDNGAGGYFPGEPGFPGPSALGIGPEQFTLPIDGGTQQVSGATPGTLAFSNTGTLTLTPQDS